MVLYNACVQAFDDLLLVKVGGRVIYHGRIGPSSNNLVQYFEVSPLAGTASSRWMECDMHLYHNGAQKLMHWYRPPLRKA